MQKLFGCVPNSNSTFFSEQLLWRTRCCCMFHHGHHSSFTMATVGKEELEDLQVETFSFLVSYNFDGQMYWTLTSTPRYIPNWDFGAPLNAYCLHGVLFLWGGFICLKRCLSGFYGSKNIYINDRTRCFLPEQLHYSHDQCHFLQLSGVLMWCIITVYTNKCILNIHTVCIETEQEIPTCVYLMILYI